MCPSKPHSLAWLPLGTARAPQVLPEKAATCLVGALLCLLVCMSLHVFLTAQTCHRHLPHGADDSCRIKQSSSADISGNTSNLRFSFQAGERDVRHSGMVVGSGHRLGSVLVANRISLCRGVPICDFFPLKAIVAVWVVCLSHPSVPHMWMLKSLPVKRHSTCMPP